METLKKKMAGLREEKENALAELEGVKAKLRDVEQESAGVRYLFVCVPLCSLSFVEDTSEPTGQS